MAGKVQCKTHTKEGREEEGGNWKRKREKERDRKREAEGGGGGKWQGEKEKEKARKGCFVLVNRSRNAPDLAEGEEYLSPSIW